MARILIVDDEPLIGMMLHDWLTELGHAAIGPAASVDAAMAMIEGSVPDGAILDVSLGGQTSFAIAQALSARGVPIAFATGHAGDALEPPFRNSPLLCKPFDFEAMKRAIDGMKLPAA